MEFVMEKKLQELMIELFRMKQSEISDSLTMEDIDVWDSLKHMELIVALENQFGIDLTFEEIVTMKSVKDIKHILNNKGVKG